MKHSETPRFAHAKRLLTLLLLGSLLTGCSATLKPSACSCAKLPEPPLLSTPLPQTSYLESVLEDLKKWQARLSAIRLTSEP